VEAKFRNKPKYYDAMVANYCPSTNTYALRYDDGDVEISVAAALVRKRPDPRAGREQTAQSLWATAPLAPTGNDYLAAASHLPGSGHSSLSSLSTTSTSGSTSTRSSSSGPRYEGRLFVPQVGDQVVYYPSAHLELLLGPKAAHSLLTSQARAAASAAETGEDHGDESTENAAAVAAANSPQMRALRAAAEKDGAPGWLGAHGAPHAVDCTVTAVQPRFSADWAQKLYARCDRMLSVMECHESYVWFSEPVQPEAQGVPDYFDVIHRPMV
jgi:hypothetical protein